MVSRLESSTGKLVPDILPVDSLGHLQRDLQVPALDGEVESCLLVLDEMKSDLGVTLLLQVPDDALSDQVGCPNDLQDFVVVLSDEGQLEAVLCRVDRDSSGLGASVKAVDDVALDSGEVDGLLERLYDTVVAACDQL